MSQEKKEQKEEDSSLLRRYIKRVTVFGTSQEQGPEEAKDFKELGSTLGGLGLTVVMGGSGGSLGEVSRGATENNGWVLVVRTEMGKKAGFETRNTPNLRGVYYRGGRGSKQRGLFDMSGAYIVLPGQSQGTHAEIVSALDEITNFNNIVGGPEKPLIFLGNFWKEEYETSLKPKVRNTRELEHIYFVQNIGEIEEILYKYAQKRKDKENAE